MNTQHLITQHMALECIRVGAGDPPRLHRLPCDDPDDIPLFYVARHPDGAYSRYHHADLPEALVRDLAHLPDAVTFNEHAAIKARLVAYQSVEKIHIGRSYVFPIEHGLTPAQDFPDVTRLPSSVYGVLVAGAAVATCSSTRANDEAAEAWVYTEAAYRRRGYARQVVAAWGAAQVTAGITAFYSHVIDNHASAAIAQSLGLQEYMADVGYYGG